ncbi:hypothetical protein GCM10010912_69650 [Paenibacillus albidus]|uniref:Transposase IS801/IS1294 domain-containing protein n=1 Tax=Paenibacillus albidus TaxID=2041023 RepID=A0A917FZJ2_9BACL|nr:hypothetical protein GCM10010912_69650 [Paenibacillus albidus]
MHAPKQKGNVKNQLGYIGRYIKRPAIALMRIQSYDGEHVIYSYYDKKSGEEKSEQVTVEEFIARVIRHIPDEHLNRSGTTGVFPEAEETKQKARDLVAKRGQKVDCACAKIAQT